MITEKKKIGELKKTLAICTAKEFALVLRTKELQPQLMDGFIDVFCAMQNKTLERFRGLIAGVPMVEE